MKDCRQFLEGVARELHEPFGLGVDSPKLFDAEVAYPLPDGDDEEVVTALRRDAQRVLDGTDKDLRPEATAWLRKTVEALGIRVIVEANEKDPSVPALVIGRYGEQALSQPNCATTPVLLPKFRLRPPE